MSRLISRIAISDIYRDNKFYSDFIDEFGQKKFDYCWKKTILLPEPNSYTMSMMYMHMKKNPSARCEGCMHRTVDGCCDFDNGAAQYCIDNRMKMYRTVRD